MKLKVKISLLFKLYIFLNIYKPILGLFTGKSLITAFSLLILIFIFAYSLLRRYSSKYSVSYLNAYIILLIFVLFFHFFYSLLFGEATIMVTVFSSLMQLLTPLLFVFIIRTLDTTIINDLASYLQRILVPVIIFALIELMLPLSIRTAMYMFYSKLSTGDAQLDVAYYLGDSAFTGLRLGSLFFEPLTFGFVSSFLVIYKITWKKKQVFLSFITNIFSLGKLPVFTTFFALLSKFFGKLSIFYYFLGCLVVAGYFIINGVSIIQNNPSMANHLIGLSSGIVNGLEKPLAGHGLGSAGYVALLTYIQSNTTGPFYRDTEFMNGNESGVGIMLYQLGFIISVLYLLFIFFVFLDVYKDRSRIMAGCVLSYLIALFLSESVLGITVLSTLIIFSYAKFERK